ncbi:MAG: M1 family peptidase, partial [Thiobacillaceae bacterium]
MTTPRYTRTVSRGLAAGLLVFALAAAAEPPRLALDVWLEPATRELAARAQLSGVEGPLRFRLDPGLRITRLVVDGRSQPLPPVGAPVDLPAGRRISVEYRGRLAPLPEADHRQVLGRLPPSASPAGSFLPAGTGWYPDPGVPFAYRVRLTLPKGQKGLVPGNRLRELEDARGYSAEFDFPHPAEGIDLMAGPYTVSERLLTLEDGRRVRIRTWFHPELADLAPDYLADSARYIERYSRLIGPYPFDDFGVVASPLPTGFGMASLTYLGREVLRLPFIRQSSLGHEV